MRKIIPKQKIDKMETPCTDLGQCAECSKDVLKWTIIANYFMAVVKFTGGILSGSVGLFADGAQSLVNIIASSFISFSITLSKKKRDKGHPYGHGKLEFIVALAVYSLLFGLGLFITVSSVILVFSTRIEGPGLIGLPLALTAVFLTYLQYRYNLCAGRKLNSCGIMANAVNAKADMLTSVAASLGIILSQLGPGFAVFDSLAALIVGLVILRDAVVLWLANFKFILDKVPEPDYQTRIKTEIAGIFTGGIKLLPPKRVGRKYWIRIGLEIPGDFVIADLEKTQDEIKSRLMAKIDWVEEIDFYIQPLSMKI